MFKFGKISVVLLIVFISSSVFWSNSNTYMTTNIQKIDMDNYKKYKDNSVLGILKIPALALEQPVYKKDSLSNNVEENVYLLEESITVNSDNHEIIVASHSGNGLHAYFKNLTKLKEGDNIEFIYQDEILKYKFFKKEEVLKTGTVYLEDYAFSHIVLITCSKTKSDIQEVYYAKLEGKNT